MGGGARAGKPAQKSPPPPGRHPGQETRRRMIWNDGPRSQQTSSAQSLYDILSKRIKIVTL
jgi:hypothetical protein